MLGSGPHFLSTLTGSSCYTVLGERGSSKESLLVGWLQGLQLVLVTARLLFLLGIAVQDRSVLLASLFLFTGVGWGDAFSITLLVGPPAFSWNSLPGNPFWPKVIAMRLQDPLARHEPLVACPKCSFEQEAGPECHRCGIIFAKFKPSTKSIPETVTGPVLDEPQPKPSGFLARVFRVLPWLSLATTVGVLLLILHQTPPVPIQTDPQAAQRLTEKMAYLHMAMQAGSPHTLSLDESELNQWMRENVAIASAHQAQQAGMPFPAGHEPTVQEVQSALKDVRMNLMGNQLRAYALFVLYGKEISLQLDGMIETHDGYVRLKPTAGKLGSLPIPSSTLEHVVQQLFDSPQNRDKFQLPPQVTAIRVENGRLVMSTR